MRPMPSPLLAAFLLVGLLAPSTEAEPPGVRTDRSDARVLPVPKEEGVFHFAIYGDRTGGPPEGIEVLKQAVADTNLLDPDLVMTVGDLVQGYNRRPAWLRQMEEYRGVMAALRMPWYPVAGNHDVYWRGSPPPDGHHEAGYEEHFGPLWYWFPHKNAAFVALYSDEGDPSSNEKGWRSSRVNRFSEKQLTWLQRTLKDTRAYDHVFLFMHHPRWRTDYYRGSNWDAVHDLLVETGNVTGVFAGHMHRQRYDGVRDGIEYFTLAATGGRLPFESPRTGFLHHQNLVTVRKEGIQVATIPVGVVVDPREMTPRHLEEIDSVRNMQPDTGDSVLAFDTAGFGEGRYRMDLENPTSRPIELTLDVKTDDAAWSFAPEHVHMRLEPGETRVTTFDYARRPERRLQCFRFPDLLMHVDYLAEGARISVPDRRLGLQWKLRDVPPETFQPDVDASLELAGDGGCLLVESVRLPVPDGPFTIEARVKSDDYGGRRALLAKTERSDYGLFVSDGRPSFAVYLDKGYVTVQSSKPLLEGGRWHHVAGVFDGRQAYLYVDGELVGSREGQGKRRRNAWPLYIGADPNGAGRPTSTLKGRIDEVRVSRVARYVTSRFDVRRRFEPDEDTLLLLHLDAPVGPFAPDHSPYGRHARRHGKVSYSVSE